MQHGELIELIGISGWLIWPNGISNEKETMKDKCPRCDGELIARKGKYGDFFGCSNFPECKYITKARLSKIKRDSDFRDSQIVSGSFENGKRR